MSALQILGESYEGEVFKAQYAFTDASARFLLTPENTFDAEMVDELVHVTNQAVPAMFEPFALVDGESSERQIKYAAKPKPDSEMTPEDTIDVEFKLQNNQVLATVSALAALSSTVTDIRDKMEGFFTPPSQRQTVIRRVLEEISNPDPSRSLSYGAYEINPQFAEQVFTDMRVSGQIREELRTPFITELNALKDRLSLPADPFTYSSANTFVAKKRDPYSRDIQVMFNYDNDEMDTFIMTIVMPHIVNFTEFRDGVESALEGLSSPDGTVSYRNIEVLNEGENAILAKLSESSRFISGDTLVKQKVDALVRDANKAFEGSTYSGFIFAENDSNPTSFMYYTVADEAHITLKVEIENENDVTLLLSSLSPDSRTLHRILNKIDEGLEGSAIAPRSLAFNDEEEPANGRRTLTGPNDPNLELSFSPEFRTSSYVGTVPTKTIPTVFDIYNQKDVMTDEFVKQDPGNHIVFLYKGKQIGTQLTSIVKNILSGDSVFYECTRMFPFNPTENQFGTFEYSDIYAEPHIELALTARYYIPFNEFIKVLSVPTHVYWEIKDTGKKLEFAASRSSVLAGGPVQSQLHCQDGSDLTVFTVEPYTPEPVVEEEEEEPEETFVNVKMGEDKTQIDIVEGKTYEYVRQAYARLKGLDPSKIQFIFGAGPVQDYSKNVMPGATLLARQIGGRRTRRSKVHPRKTRNKKSRK